MPQLFVPEIGTKLVLKTDWNFELFHESRNKALWEAFGHIFDYRASFYVGVNKTSIPCIIPADTQLMLDRIYIRKGKEDFSSLSWFIEDSPDTRLNPTGLNKGFVSNKKRFWAKLDDCNNIIYV
jgi:hypothetical protein